MKLIVDRITEGIAVLEKSDLTHTEVPRELLPEQAKQGSVLEFDGEKYTLLSAEEEERRSRIAAKQSMIFKKAKKD